MSGCRPFVINILKQKKISLKQVNWNIKKRKFNINMTHIVYGWSYMIYDWSHVVYDRSHYFLDNWQNKTLSSTREKWINYNSLHLKYVFRTRFSILHYNWKTNATYCIMIGITKISLEHRLKKNQLLLAKKLYI